MMPISLASFRVVAISADSAASGRLGELRGAPDSGCDGEGFLNAASAAWLLRPGKCLMSNRHGRVRCFRRNKRELGISSRVRSPKIFIKGLWSVTMTRLSHP